MLAELRVRDLGVIADLTLVLGPGMTALTGETGAGKTLVVEAIELLVGGRADSVLVRPGASEATVEGRFVTVPANPNGATSAAQVSAGHDVAGEHDDDDLVLARTVPASGRSRAYVHGRMSALSALEERGRQLVDLHGQHTQQSLLATAVQRASLDAFGAIDRGPVDAAHRRMRSVDEALGRLGGDGRARARQLELLRYQVHELAAARVEDPDEELVLEEEEDRLADATAHRQAAMGAVEALAGDGGVADGLARVDRVLAGRSPLSQWHDRLRAVAVEVQDLASELRTTSEALEDDPERLAEVRARRQLLRDLCRKYGDTLADVIGFAGETTGRLAQLESDERGAADLDRERAEAASDLDRAEAALGAARRAAAPALAAAVEENLHRLAMPKARFEVRVGDDPAGQEVTWMLAANPGEPALPLAKVVSGGELARTMLAVRLVLSGLSTRPEKSGQETVRTLVFDEVDAGIGGEAALAVGRALADLGRRYQVLVVTHLPQVAAFADDQVAVRKGEAGARTVATAERLGTDGRIVELSRMLSGQPNSASARLHAEELLASARNNGRLR